MALTLLFSKYTNHREKEKKYIAKLQRAKDDWNQDIMNCIGFFDDSLSQINRAKICISNVAEAILKTIKDLNNE